MDIATEIEALMVDMEIAEMVEEIEWITWFLRAWEEYNA